MFVEPASAAGIAGLLAEVASNAEEYAGTTVVITVTGHGLKDIETALRGPARSVGNVVDADVAQAAAAAELDEAVTPSSKDESASPYPATSANLGPGFDSLGLALALRDEVSAEVHGEGVSVTVRGEGADTVPRDESHLVVRSMLAAFDLLGARPPGLEVTCRNVIPHGRGLGSSSAAIVAGVSLARALVAGGSLLVDDAGVRPRGRDRGAPRQRRAGCSAGW